MVQSLDLPVVPDQLRELGRGGLLGGQAGDRIDGGDGDLAGLAVGAAPLDLDRLAGAGEEQVADGGDLDPADLGAAMAAVPGAALKRDFFPGQGLELLAQLLLVAFDNRDVVGPAAREVSGMLACVWSASLVTTVPARLATVSNSGWKQVVSPVFSPTSSWATTTPDVCSRAAAGGPCGRWPWPRRAGSSRPRTARAIRSSRGGGRRASRPRPGPERRRRCGPAVGGPSPPPAPAVAAVPDQDAHRAVPAPAVVRPRSTRRPRAVRLSRGSGTSASRSSRPGTSPGTTWGRSRSWSRAGGISDDASAGTVFQAGHGA
ncbi:hypothetical protein SCANM124S_06992 [Streptomyces canus]